MSRLILSSILGDRLKKGSDFPEIIGHAINSNGSAVSEIVITVPANYQNGDILVSIGRIQSTISDLQGFSVLVERNSQTVLWRTVSGVMPESYSLTLNSTNRYAVVTYLIRNATNIENEFTTSGVNPPEITPSWGKFKNLYLAYFTSRSTNQVVSEIPENYTDLITAQSWPTSVASSTQFNVFTVRRFLESESEDPSTFVATNQNTVESGTIAIKGK
jgi:hypothetical protein